MLPCNHPLGFCIEPNILRESKKTIAALSTTDRRMRRLLRPVLFRSLVLSDDLMESERISPYRRYNERGQFVWTSPLQRFDMRGMWVNNHSSLPAPDRGQDPTRPRVTAAQRLQRRIDFLLSREEILHDIRVLSFHKSAKGDSVTEQSNGDGSALQGSFQILLEKADNVGILCIVGEIGTPRYAAIISKKPRLQALTIYQKEHVNGEEVVTLPGPLPSSDVSTSMKRITIITPFYANITDNLFAALAVPLSGRLFRGLTELHLTWVRGTADPLPFPNFLDGIRGLRVLHLWGCWLEHDGPYVQIQTKCFLSNNATLESLQLSHGFELPLWFSELLKNRSLLPRLRDFSGDVMTAGILAHRQSLTRFEISDSFIWGRVGQHFTELVSSTAGRSLSLSVNIRHVDSFEVGSTFSWPVNLFPENLHNLTSTYD